MKGRTAVVVPCYNEAERLDGEAFVRFAVDHPDCSFIFVDDGSTDATRSVLDALSARHERVVVHAMPQNSGKAEAVRAGILEALRSDVHFVAYWDADLATPLDELPRMLERFAQRPELGIVLGSRIRMLGRVIDRREGRHYVGRAFATAASLVLRMPVYDTQCGAKVLRVESSLDAVFSEPFRSRWIFDVELLRRLQGVWGPAAQERMEEFPLATWRDVAGSRLKFRHMIGAAFDLLRIATR